MMIMGASFVGFGSMMHDMNWSVWEALYSTFSTWALPGQIAMAEMAATGAPLMAIVLTVAFINARLLPMVASLLPQVRRPGIPTWAYYASAMLIAATFAGYMLAGHVPAPVTMALVYLNPLYFMVLFLVDLRSRTKILAIIFGAVLGPVTFLFAPDWSLVITGLIGGTAAWLLGRNAPPRHGGLK